MNVFKRVLNVIFAWFIVLWAPVMAMTFCFVCVVYKVFEGKYPSDQSEKVFKMLCLGDTGLFSVSYDSNEPEKSAE